MWFERRRIWHTCNGPGQLQKRVKALNHCGCLERLNETQIDELLHGAVESVGRDGGIRETMFATGGARGWRKVRAEH